jgi:hypothetical protein
MENALRPSLDINVLSGDVQYAPLDLKAFLKDVRRNKYSPESRAVMEEIHNRPLYYYEGIPYSTRQMINQLVPVNMRAYAGTYVGADEPITAAWFTPEQLDYMGQQRGLMRMQEKMAPYPKGMERYSREQSVVPEQGLPAWYHMPAHVLQSYQEPEVATRPFTTGGYYATTNQGPALRNTYEVNGFLRDVDVLLPQYEGPFPSSYARPRSQR